jgi:hypothetical protein
MQKDCNEMMGGKKINMVWILRVCEETILIDALA